MKKTIVVYGSSTGSCQEFAEQIAHKLGACDVRSVAAVSADTLAGYDNLLLGTSTWGVGELQDDWYNGLAVLRSADLRGKRVAIFGCGDSDGYGDTFCAGMAEIYNAVKERGAKVIGHVAATTYQYSASKAVIDGKFVGLALDCSESQGKSENRIDDWLDSLRPEL